MVPVSYYLAISAVMFTLGAVGVMVRRNAIVVFMCIELMLNAVNVTFVALSHGLATRGLPGGGLGLPAGMAVQGPGQPIDGQIAVFFVMVVAAAEAAVGLAIILSVFRVSRSIETEDIADLKH